jgi:ribosomal protein S18 acetylase RimI-like enzyme
MGAVSVRPMRADDWSAYRTLRLRALEDSPAAFGSTLADALKLSDADWQERLQGLSADRDLPLFASCDGTLAGLAWGRFEAPDPERAWLFHMWVAPEYRGLGIGRRLVDAVLEWARACGARVVELDVTCGNAAAEGLYRAAGFEPRGAPRPIAEGGADAGRLEQAMVRSLEGG